jgi:HEAT repeat protein
LYTLRKVNACHQNAYDQYLFEILAKEILGERQHDVEYLEAAVHVVTQNLKFLDLAPIALMASLLEHEHLRVRAAAVNAFPLLATRGDSHAIAAVAERFGHPKKVVRSAALNALAKIADRGNGAAIAIVVAGLEDAEPQVRVAAVRAFAHIAEKNDAVAAAAVVKLLGDTTSNVKCAALRTLSQIAKKGDADIIAAVLTRLEDPRAAVRNEAVNTLAQIVEKGDTGAIAAVLVFLEHRHEEVRIAAVYTLGQIQEKGNAATINAIAACLEDPDIAVQRAAVAVLPQISEKGNSAAIAALVALIEDRSLRHGVRKALLQLTEGNERTIAALFSMADIGFHLTAALRIPNEGEAEAVAAAAESLEDAKMHLAMRSQYFMMSAQAHLGIGNEGELNGKATSPMFFRESQLAGDTRNLGTSFCDFFRRTGILHMLIGLIAIYSASKTVTRVFSDLHADFMLHTTENMMD